MEENKNANELIEEAGNEVSIDNDPDKIDFSKFGNKIKKNPWILASAILGVVVLVLLYMNFSGGVTGNVISEDDASSKILDFAKAQGANVELVEVNDEDSFYEVVVSMQGRDRKSVV